MSNQVTEIKGIEVIFDKIHKDDRGSIFKISQQVLDRFFKRDVGRDVIFCVNNLAGTVRGLHMQSKNHHEAKYIKCTQGVIQEFFLDLRDSSATFGKYMSIYMNSRENLSVYVPPGIAHGYQTLEDNTNLLYVLTSNYSENEQLTIDIFDSDLGIKLPVECSKVSTKDLNGIAYLKLIENFQG